MSTIVESIQVEIYCDRRWKNVDTCYAEAQVTVVSTVEKGDLILGPVDWQAVQSRDSEEGWPHIGWLCPNHKEEK